MALIPRRLSLPNVKDELRDINQELYDYFIALNKQLTRSYDHIYMAVKPEEGVFSPELWDGSLSGDESQTYDVQKGFYTLIDERIYYDLAIGMSSLGSLDTGHAARIGGLPYALRNEVGRINSVQVGYGSGLNITAGVSVSGYISPGEDYIHLVQFDATSGSSFLTIAEISATGYLIVSGNYPR